MNPPYLRSQYEFQVPPFPAACCYYQWKSLFQFILLASSEDVQDKTHTDEDHDTWAKQRHTK